MKKSEKEQRPSLDADSRVWHSASWWQRIASQRAKWQILWLHICQQGAPLQHWQTMLNLPSCGWLPSGKSTRSLCAMVQLNGRWLMVIRLMGRILPELNPCQWNSWPSSNVWTILDIPTSPKRTRRTTLDAPSSAMALTSHDSAAALVAMACQGHPEAGPKPSMDLKDFGGKCCRKLHFFSKMRGSYKFSLQPSLRFLQTCWLILLQQQAQCHIFWWSGWCTTSSWLGL